MQNKADVVMNKKMEFITERFMETGKIRARNDRTKIAVCAIFFAERGSVKCNG
jgi:hypothetical protein